jgi:serine/threonine protein kinase/uncharacterized protein YbaR (Trm112 family)
MTRRPQQIGNYVLEREVGRGGSSEVWLARHAHLEERQVAIKILTDNNKESIQRFNREANLAGRLSHPQIVRLYDHGYTGAFYYSIFEYIPGGSLRQLIEKRNRLPLTDAVAIFKQVAVALDYAHSLNIIHRDVSPGNVLLEQATGRALLTDFGIAREMDNTITVVHSVMGTPGYWSPEHAQSATLVSRLSDIYSLGVVFYVMLAGDLPWDETPGLSNRVFGPPLPLKQRGVDNLPVDIDRILQTMLATDPAKRFPTASAAVEELERVLVRHEVQTQINPQLAKGKKRGAARDQGADDRALTVLSAGVEINEVETVLGPTLIRAPIADAHKRAKELSQPEVIANLLDNWARQGRFRRTLLGRMAHLHKVQSRNIYFYKVRVLYEYRDPPYAVEEPDRHKEALKLEPELDRWQVALSPVHDFKDETGVQVVLPGSTKIVDCPDCKAKGKIVCPNCKGKSRVLVKQAPDEATGKRAASRSSGAVRMQAAEPQVVEASRRVTPTTAGAATAALPVEPSLVACPVCEGYGGLKCERCEGVGRLIQRDAFRWRRFVRDIQGNDDLPDHDEEYIRKQCKMQEIYCERANNGFRFEWGQIPTLRELVQKAQAATDDDTRIILSEVTISLIPVTDIIFDLGKFDPGSDNEGLNKVSIYGFERYIPPDWRFLNWERVIYICVIGFLLVLIVIFGIFAFAA